MENNNYRKLAVWLTGIPLFFAACTTDVYEPKTGPTPNEEGVSQELKDFGFATRADVKLSVNYNAPGFKALMEVYSENPLVDGTNKKKDDIKPVYSAFTDDKGKFDGKMNIPTAVKEAYLYTDTWGVPQCVKLEALLDGFSYDVTASSGVTTKAGSDYTSYFSGNIPYDLKNGPTVSSYRQDNIFSICKWENLGKPEASHLTLVTDINGTKVSDLAQRTKNAFDKKENKKEFISEAKTLNITIPKGGAEISVVFLTERALFTNTFGYYYYKKDDAPIDNTIYAPKSGGVGYFRKFIVFPNCSLEDGVLQAGSTAKLKYFGPDGTGEAQDQFPEDYVIGWFFISSGYNMNSGTGFGSNTIYEGRLPGYQPGTMFTSDEKNVGTGSGNQSRDDRRFVSLQDSNSNILVFGFEDQLAPNNDEDYSDALFSIISDKDLTNGERPELPEEKPEDPVGEELVSGTLAFEDIWPTGGDYDMNDVALEYNRTILFDKENNVTTLEENFKFIQKNGAASIDNYFAYQVENMGTVVEKPADCTIESETNSFIITSSAKTTSGKEFTIKRTFNGSLNKDVVSKDFNPYIIVGKMGDNRTEVHLPMMKATSKANPNLVGTVDEAYYMDKEGKYPFAIDIAKAGFVLSREARSIDSTYPRFATWAKSMGKTDADWYMDEPKEN